MNTRIARRLAVAALMGVVGVGLAAGSLPAQAPAAAPAGAQAGAHTPEAIWGVWSVSPECRLEDPLFILSPRMIIQLQAGGGRAIVTYETAQDGIVVTPVRAIVQDGPGWRDYRGPDAGTRQVYVRRGNTLAPVRQIDRNGQSRPLDGRPELYYACF